jgi:hypothetical protein
MKNCKLILIVFITILAFNANAQISFGVKAEIGATNAPSEGSYGISSENIVTYKISFLKTSPIKSIGLYTQMESGYLFFRSELLYSTSKHYYAVMNFISDDPVDIEMIENNETMDLNVLGGLKIQNIRIGVGPSFHFLTSKTNPMESIEAIQFNERTLTTGFNFELGYDLGRLSFDLRYENIFSTVGDHIYVENQKSGLKSSADKYSFAVGIKF